MAYPLFSQRRHTSIYMESISLLLGLLSLASAGSTRSADSSLLSRSAVARYPRRCLCFSHSSSAEVILEHSLVLLTHKYKEGITHERPASILARFLAATISQ